MAREQSVLIVTDDPELARIAGASTEEVGGEGITVPSADEAIAAATDREITMAVVDLDVPETDGWKVIEELQRLYFRRPLQVLLCSKHDEQEFAEAALNAGGDDFLTKPIDERQMKLRLRAATIRSRHQTDLHHEREFYRRAVKQEEELSSRVLDQNLHLRKAYEEVAGLNRELERVNQELERVARFDVLSGLMNRMSLFDALNVEIERSMRSGLPLCGIMVDIDHFKEVNDTFGHPCGDKVIRELGAVFRRELRKYDYAGRYGGEEFFVALPNSSLNQASMFGERVRSSLEELSVECEEGAVTISVSMGVAKFRRGESRDMWISRTDRAMYVAKQKGRNRIEIEPSP
ncbi:MAG: diguanylate cyclase [Spirochaetes bacterium]|nr:diguanylate cyclase [Spirochaetota bacterium]